MISTSFSTVRIAALVVAVALASACSDDTPATEPEESNGSVLAGLSIVGRNDTVKTPPPTQTGSGYFRGTVMGPALPGAGNDSLSTSPRLAGVTVTIYPRIESTLSSQIPVGPAAGSSVTNAQGLFQLPVLPAGEYVVTFVPPAGSVHQGVYAFGPLRSNSGDYPWWVVLPKK
jgi:hypothetical protein